MSIQTIDVLTTAAILADDAWQAALIRAYGKRAGDARYDARGQATEELRRLCAEMHEANEARHAATMAKIHG